MRRQTCTSSSLQELDEHGNTRASSQSMSQGRPRSADHERSPTAAGGSKRNKKENLPLQMQPKKGGYVTRFGKAFTCTHSAFNSLAALQTQRANSEHLADTDLLPPIPFQSRGATLN